MNTIHASVSIPPEAFQQLNISGDDVDIVFTLFNTSVLFPLANEIKSTFGVASSVISATIIGYDTTDLIANITFIAELEIPVRTIIDYTFVIEDTMKNINNENFPIHGTLQKACAVGYFYNIIISLKSFQ